MALIVTNLVDDVHQANDDFISDQLKSIQKSEMKNTQLCFASPAQNDTSSKLNETKETFDDQTNKLITANKDLSSISTKFKRKSSELKNEKRT